MKFPRPSRSWLRFRLRTMLAAFVVLVVVLGMFAMPWYREHLRKQAVLELKDRGVLTLSNPEGGIVRAHIEGDRFDDEQLREIVQLLRRLPALAEIDLVRNRVTDNGLASLERLTKFETLYLYETEVTNEGIARLAAARPDLDIRQEKPDPIASGLVSTDIYRHAIATIAFHKQSQDYLVGTGNGELQVWRSGLRSTVNAVAAHNDWLFAIAISGDGQSIATGGGDNLVRLWNVKSLRPVLDFHGHDNDVHAVAFSPDSKFIYSAGDDLSLRCWEVANGKQLWSTFDHDEQIPSLAVSPAGDVVATGSRDDKIRLWDASDGRLLLVIDGHDGDVMSLAFDKGGKQIASASYDGSVRMWNVSDGKEQRRFDGHTDRVFAICINENGNLIASGGADGVSLWDVETSNLLFRQTGAVNVSTVQFCESDNSLIVTDAEGLIHSIDIKSGGLQTLAAVSPAGRRSVGRFVAAD